MSVGKCCSWDRSFPCWDKTPFHWCTTTMRLHVHNLFVVLFSNKLLWDTACLNKHQPIRVKMAELLVCIKILCNFTIFWVLNYYVKESSLESFEDTKEVMSKINSICVQLWTFLFSIIWDTRLLKFSWVNCCCCPSLYNILHRNLVILHEKSAPNVGRTNSSYKCTLYLSYV
jgi:hypothetical protein